MLLTTTITDHYITPAHLVPHQRDCTITCKRKQEEKGLMERNDFDATVTTKLCVVEILERPLLGYPPYDTRQTIQPEGARTNFGRPPYIYCISYFEKYFTTYDKFCTAINRMNVFNQ